jgi:hypothetical protein
MILLLATASRAEDIEGVQPAALDQPRINLAIRRQARGQVLAGKGLTGDETFNVEAFLDTGASGIVLSVSSADTLGIQRPKAGRIDVKFEDIGVGGGSKFGVSEPLFFSMAPYTPSTDTEHKDAVNGIYSETAGPYRAQVGPLDAGNDLLGALIGQLDVAGIPAMQGKIVVMDVGPVNTFTDKIRTWVFDARLRNPPAPGIPQTRRHVKLSYASFGRFTHVEPAGAQGPVIAPNPFIGPSPLQPAGDATPPMTVAHNGKSLSASWLLDTGAAASMISRKHAEKLGVTYAGNSFGTDSPKLAGVPADKQFTMTVGGIGGAKKTAGFFIDKLTVRTREGQPLTYVKAPVLVMDITVKDPANGQELTLDGVFGMNFLVASAKVTEGLLPDIENLTPGAFRWIVFDQPNGVLGLE